MPRNEWLQIRVTEELKNKLREIADRKSLTMSALALYYVSQGIDNDTQVQKLLTPESYNKMLQGLSPEVVEQLTKEFKK